MTEDEAHALYVKIGERVVALRADYGFTQSRLAELVGLSRASIANFEAGRQRIPVHVLVDIADALGVTVVDLIGDVATGRAFDGLAAFCQDQAEEIRRLKGLIRDARRALGDTCV